MRLLLPLVVWAVLSAGVPVVSVAEVSEKEVDVVVVASALETFKVPGAAVAVVREDKLIHLKGYGVREVGTAEAVTGGKPSSRSCPAPRRS